VKEDGNTFAPGSSKIGVVELILVFQNKLAKSAGQAKKVVFQPSVANPLK